MTVIQLTSSRVASRAFSTALTCQTSWGARARTRDVGGRCDRRGRLTPARWNVRCSMRGEGTWVDAKLPEQLQADQAGPPGGDGRA